MAALSASPAANAQTPGKAAPDFSPWGISSSAGSTGNCAEWFPAAARAGVQYVRMFPEWSGVERSPGVWKWDSADALLKAADDNKLRINAILMGSMRGDKAGSHAFPMNNLDEWTGFVSAAVERYKGRIQYWEVWNEGNGGFNDGKHTTVDYARMASATYAAAKKADPAAKVGLTVASFDAPYLHQTILAQKEAGSPDSFDFLCIHPYEIADGVDKRDGEIPWLWMTHQLRGILNSAAPSRADAEIWVTEAGRNIARAKDQEKAERQAAAVLVKLYVMSLAQGIRCVQWFEGQDPPNEEAGFGLIRRDGKPRAALAAFSTMTGVLGLSPQYLGWLTPGNDQSGYGFVFQGRTGPVMVAWLTGGAAPQEVKFAGEVQRTGLAGGAATVVKAGAPFQLTGEPVFISGLSQSAVAQAKQNATKPFPWGGNFSAAKSVSARPGSPEQRNGMFQTSPDDTPAIKFADGSTGVLVRGDQAVSFFVHPSFASFQTREYWVRLTVRRINPGNVGMNLVYEVADSQGRSPYKNTGQWFGLSDSGEWQTHTWHVKDACLSRMWGYDIGFRPEQSQPFVIGKVEVSTHPF